MKALPMETKSYRDLYVILMGAARTRLMMSALELGLFNELHTFKPAEDIADCLGTDPGNTERFLDALAMIDLIEKKDGLYRNLPITQAFLTEGSPRSMGPLFQMIKRRCIDPLNNLTHLIKEGPAGESVDWEFAAPGLMAEDTRVSAAWVMGEVGRKVAEIISKLPGFSGFEKLLDLGGGHGVFALYIVGKHPTMKGTVFDRPAVVEVAKEFIHDYGMEERVDIATGDYMSDDIGDDYDLIWASSTLNSAKWDMDALITKLYRALKPGGYFISFQDGMTHEHTKPDTMLGHVADQLKTGVDLSLDQGLVAESAIRCGFERVRSRTIETPMGAMDMDIARK